jgi:hypothetical protein
MNRKWKVCVLKREGARCHRQWPSWKNTGPKYITQSPGFWLAAARGGCVWAYGGNENGYSHTHCTCQRSLVMRHISRPPSIYWIEIQQTQLMVYSAYDACGVSLSWLTTHKAWKWRETSCHGREDTSVGIRYKQCARTRPSAGSFARQRIPRVALSERVMGSDRRATCYHISW